MNEYSGMQTNSWHLCLQGLWGILHNNIQLCRRDGHTVYLWHLRLNLLGMMCSVIETTKESDIRILLSETFSSLFAFFVLPFSCNNAFWHWDHLSHQRQLYVSFSLSQFLSFLFAFLLLLPLYRCFLTLGYSNSLSTQRRIDVRNSVVTGTNTRLDMCTTASGVWHKAR